jgi:hypothetical protein
VEHHPIVHALNNHLTAILGHAELLEHRLADDELRRHAHEIIAAATQAGLLTRKLL